MKKTIFISAFCFLLSAFVGAQYLSTADGLAQLTTVPSAGGPTNVVNGLVGWWKFDEGSGTTANDSSDSGFTGTINGGASYVSGRVGTYALALDGSSAYVSFGTHAGLQNQVFTYIAWVFVNNVNNPNAIYGAGSTLGEPCLRINNGTMTLTGEYIFDVGMSVGTVANSTWTQVSVTYDVSGNYAFYTNGIAAGSGNNLQTFIFVGNAQTGRINDTASPTWFFGGSIDDVRVYNRALSSDEVLNIYNFTK
jgi:hypothetical protein